MRLSVIPGDRGYRELVSWYDAGRAPVVYIDGVEIDAVTTVDTDLCYADRWITDDDGNCPTGETMRVRGSTVRVRRRPLVNGTSMATLQESGTSERQRPLLGCSTND